MTGTPSDSYAVVLSPTIRISLEKIARNGPDDLARRARIILLRSSGLALNPIARSVGLHRDSVRRWIKRFCVRGLPGLQHGNTGKAKNVVFDASVCAKIRQRASTSPAALGEPYSAWSLYKLRDHLIRHGIVRTISVERLRQLLAAEPYVHDYWPIAARRVRVGQPTNPITLPLAHHSGSDHRWLDLLQGHVAEPAPHSTASLRRTANR